MEPVNRHMGNRHMGKVGGYRAKPSAENPHDFYPTPIGVTRAFLESSYCPLPRGGIWCEPCVGDGHIVEAAGPVGTWVTFDIRDVPRPALSAHHEQLDFLTFDPGGERFDVTITNPPFYLAEEIVRKALTCSTYVAMLLRLAFLETRKREAFHDEFKADVHVLSRRPSFTDNGATDATAYAWFVWGPGLGGRWYLLRTPETSKQKR